MGVLLAGEDAKASQVDASASAPVTGAARVGAELRAARLRLGWRLPDVASSLRIRLAYLEAIEEGRVADLPGNAYAVGFVRAYATSLGLEADEVARRFRAEAVEVNGKPELAFPAPVPERGIPAGAVILVGVVIAALAYAAWFRYGDDRAAPRAEVVPPVPAHLAPLAGPLSPPSPQVASIMPDKPVPPPPAPPVSSAPIQPASPAPSPPSASAPAPVQAGPAPGVQATTPAPPAPAVATVPAAAPPPATPTVPAGTRVVVQATADAWVQVRQKGSTKPPILSRLLRQGETFQVPDEPNLVLTTGNAGGVELLVDGQPVPSLGKSGVVRRDVPLDPAALAAQPAPAAAPGPSSSTPRTQAQ